MDNLASEIAAQSIGPTGSPVQLSQTQHRLNLLGAWVQNGCDFPGKTIVELGCGQGDMTAVLAHAVGTSGTGRVVAIDPAPLDYGSPWTLAQAQTHLSQGSLGKVITWVQQDPLDYFVNHVTFADADYIVLAHSIFYLQSEDYLQQLLKATHAASVQSSRRPKLLLAEWGQVISTEAARPHLQAVAIQAAHPKPTANVRIAPTPNKIVQLAEAAGWSVHGQAWIQKPQLHDGEWEAHAAGIAGPAKGFSHSTLKALEALGETAKDAPDKIAAMDVWTAVLSI